MKRTGSALLLLAGAMTLAGCSSPFGKEGYIRDRSGDYTEARTTKPVEIPEDMDSQVLGDILVIPQISQSSDDLSKEFEAPRAPQRLMLKEGDSYSIERSSTQDWLAVDRTVAEVWPGLVSYVKQMGANVVVKNPVNGTIETGWMDYSKDERHGVVYRTVGKLFGADNMDPMEDRFRFQLKPGEKENTAAVYVYHQGRPLSDSDSKEVPKNWDNQGERSKKVTNNVLAGLLVYLARNETKSSLSLQAQSQDLGNVTAMGRDGNGNPVLTMRGISFARAWDSTTEALNKAGLKVLDRNRSAGLLYLSDDLSGKQEKESKGFWSRLFGSDDDDGGDKENRLTLRVSNYAEVVQFSVEKDVNTSAPEDVSTRLLKLIQDNL